MAKKVDPFDKFRAATLGKSGELIDAISTKRSDESIPTPVPSPADQQPFVYDPVNYVNPQPVEQPVQKVSKNAGRELVSFHIAKDLKKKLGLLKYETDRSYGDLYIEAIEDLLKKYGKL